MYVGGGGRRRRLMSMRYFRSKSVVTWDSLNIDEEAEKNTGEL